MNQTAAGQASPSPLARVLLRRLLAAYVLVAAVVLGAQLGLTYAETRNEIRNTLNTLARTFAPGIETALWEYQATQLMSIAEGIGSHPAVVRVAIIDPTGQLSTRWQHPDAPSDAGELAIDYPLAHRDGNHLRSMGTLQIASSAAYLNTRLQNTLLRELIAGSIQFAILCLLLWLLIRQLAVRPLMNIAGQVQSLTAGKRLGQIWLDRAECAEIDALQTGFNRLMQQLAASHAEIAAQNISLERRVQDATREIREQEARFRSIFERANLGIAFGDAQGNLLEFNANFISLLGYSRDELRHMNFAQFTHADDIAREMVYFGEILTGQRSDYRMEKRYLTKSGQVLWIDLSVATIRDQDGQIANFVGLVVDITERKAIESALLDSEAKLKRAQSVAQLGSWHLDLVKNQLTWSDETCRIFGIPGGTSLAYEDFILRVHPDDRNSVDTAWRAALEGARYDIAHRIVVAGETKWVREMAELVFDSQGKFIAATGTVHDITHQVEIEDALRAAMQAAEAANRAKSEFLANMSHEIRTPMNAILGLTQLVLDTPLEESQRELLSIALSSSRALLGILNDILDYSKIEAGRLDIDKSAFSVQEVLHEIASLFSARLAEKKLELLLDIAPDLPPQVMGDPLRLHQVLANLIGNAIKFTERGEVRVEAEIADRTTDTLTLRFTVRDTGIGIRRELAQHLFEPFTQADGSITRKYGGTGLGLAICQRLVTLMGGQIGASGEEGRGATFTFTLVVGRAHPEEADSASQSSQKSALAGRHFGGAHVLVAEDNRDNQRVAAGFLEKLGIAVALAENGSEAVALASGTAFDAILMDLHMPIMDGLEATRRIRALPGCHAVPIIAMTAAVMEEDRECCRAAGMNDFVPKPVDTNELARVLGRYLNAGEPAPA